MKKKTWAAAVALLISAGIFASCSNIDVVYKYSQQSFGDIAKAAPNIIGTQGNFYTVSVDNETVLEVSKNYADSTEDIKIATPLKPFVDAGLDVGKLGEGYRADETTLYVTGDFGSGSGASADAKTALFEGVKFGRKALTYHQDLDHYGIGMTGGKFEFAKDYTKNDKDIVYAIYAKPLADLGVDVQNIQGWVFKTMKDTQGKDIDVLLKPFDLK